MTHIEGDVTNIDSPANIQAALNAQVTYGRSIRFMGKDYAIFEADGTLAVGQYGLQLTGNVQMAGGLLGKGQATVDLNWAENRYEVGYTLGMYDDVFVQHGTLVLDGGDSISIDAKATLNAPASIQKELKSFGLPTTFAEADFRMRLNGDGPASENFVEASFTTIGLTATVHYDFDNNLSLSIMNGALQKLGKVVDAAGKAITEGFNAAGHAISRTTIEAGTKIVESLDTAGNVTRRVTTAAGQTIKETLNVAGYVTYRVTQEAGQKITETFDATGHRIERITDQLGTSVVENWNSAGRLATRITYAADKTVTETMDAAGKLAKKVTEQGGRVFTDTYFLGRHMSASVEQATYRLIGGAFIQVKMLMTVNLDWYGNQMSTVTDTLTMSGRILTRLTATAAKTVQEAFNSAGHVVTRVTNEAGKTITEAFDDAGHVTKRLVNKVGDALNPANWF